MAKQEILFQEAQVTDAQALIDFMNQVALETEFLDMDEQGFQFSLEETQEILGHSQEEAGQLFLLAILGDKVIGLIHIKGARPCRVSHVGDLFMVVAKGYWGYGIGRILLEEAVVWAQEVGLLRRLELTVQARNERAIKLYQGCGFTIEGTKKRGARTDEGEWLDLYYMGRLID